MSAMRMWVRLHLRTAPTTDLARWAMGGEAEMVVPVERRDGVYWT